ncbi:M48 family metallopeptidase [Flavobacterium pallidum]|uniref:Peptidase M48 n=1 Tax=Flavobacterium pallidum TaxID=2172098 RepID=A0A2S1SJX5_9FLAO|nr:M48 family metallopeptidase [Flavobacterium pallidum]AWI26685.1 peptidase M48 [Flavobacterium pallidum]
MRKYVIISAFAVALGASCATNPFTGKKTLNFVSNDQIFPTAFAQYKQFLTENKVVSGSAAAQQVQTVGNKIRIAAEKYLNSLGQKDYLNGYAWEYKLVENKEVNAWCMPGGKIVVYSGILPVTKDEAGLATVLGHEVSHALANHGAQRMSVDQLQQLVGVGVVAATSGQSTQNQAIFQQAYGLGSTLAVTLPFSRSNESEADEIGLTLMAIAGYNPDQAVVFWQRMSANGGAAPPEFLSTHPSDATRIRNIKNLIPKAKATAAKFGVVYK